MVRVEKWHGLGNDFVLLSAESCQTAWGRPLPSSETVRRLCDRRRGVGADGVLLVEDRCAQAGKTPRMVIYNADGTRAEMCGNGLRCVAAHLVGRRGQAEAELRVQTDAGERTCRVTHADQAAAIVEVSMGLAQVGRRFTFTHEGERFALLAVDVGNPHAVGFDRADHGLIDTLGPAVDQALVGGCNVELCHVDSATGELVVTVWERGVGRTLACGTGACAAAAAAVELGKAPADAAIAVRLPGGTLQVTVPADGSEVRLRGPAQRVFVAQLDQFSGALVG